MKTLIVEDDLISRKLMVKYLTQYSKCDVAVNGEEALQYFNMALNEGQLYDLITLDIMMPKMDGQQVLKEIRRIESEKGILGHDSVKIIMISALGDRNNIMDAFKSQCEAYLTKPIDKYKVIDELKKLGLIDA